MTRSAPCDGGLEKVEVHGVWVYQPKQARATAGPRRSITGERPRESSYLGYRFGDAGVGEAGVGEAGLTGGSRRVFFFVVLVFAFVVVFILVLVLGVRLGVCFVRVIQVIAAVIDNRFRLAVRRVGRKSG